MSARPPGGRCSEALAAAASDFCIDWKRAMHRKRIVLPTCPSHLDIGVYNLVMSLSAVALIRVRSMVVLTRFQVKDASDKVELMLSNACKC